MKKRRIVEIGAILFNLFSDENQAEKYTRHYSDASFLDKLKRYAKSAGMKVVYSALLLQYLMKSEEVSLKTKLLISAGLGYFILPVDFIPDFAPMIGFADDLGVLLLILGNMANNITPEIKLKAREHLQKWFSQTDAAELDQIEAQFASGKR
jgi:uncharacterized membrane protein YkvA (DUF1232 family)